MIRMICSQEISLFVTVSSMYFGNGQTIGCSGGGSGTHGDNPNACVKFQNYEQTYKHNTTHIFRIPVEAYYLKWEQGS